MWWYLTRAESMGIFVHDTFTDPDGTLLQAHTGERGATWTKHPTFSGGDAEIEDNKLHMQSSVVAYYASGISASAEYDIDCDIVLGGNVDPDAVIEIYGRFNTTVNDHYDAIANMTNQEWQLRKVVNSSATSFGTFPMTFLNHATYHVRFSLRDAVKRLFVNGVELLSSTDNEITAANRPGFLFAGPNPSQLYIENFIALNTKTLLT